jgi:hypothetical protein
MNPCRIYRLSFPSYSLHGGTGNSYIPIILFPLICMVSGMKFQLIGGETECILIDLSSYLRYKLQENLLKSVIELECHHDK